MEKVEIFWTRTYQAYAVSFRYDANLVRLLKTVVPDGCRIWEPSKKIWLLTEEYGNKLYHYLQATHEALRITVHFTARSYTVEENQKRQRAQFHENSRIQTHNSTPIANACLNFLSLLTKEEAKSLYRKAQLRLHPDRGGNTESSARLNEAWAVIEGSLYQ